MVLVNDGSSTRISFRISTTCFLFWTHHRVLFACMWHIVLPSLRVIAGQSAILHRFRHWFGSHWWAQSFDTSLMWPSFRSLSKLYRSQKETALSSHQASRFRVATHSNYGAMTRGQTWCEDFWHANNWYEIHHSEQEVLFTTACSWREYHGCSPFPGAGGLRMAIRT